jgi:hypothetical protein
MPKAAIEKTRRKTLPLQLGVVMDNRRIDYFQPEIFLRGQRMKNILI